ncbi:hypothetical protein O9992_23980 [Vibrio lentus]|nr:hypothetical protein [Vibrio lentus]
MPDGSRALRFLTKSRLRHLRAAYFEASACRIRLFRVRASASVDYFNNMTPEQIQQLTNVTLSRVCRALKKATHT